MAGTPLNTAIGTDAFGAAAETNDLGVETVQSSGLGASVAIAPGINFNLATAGGSDGSFSPLLNDAPYVGGGGFGSIRTTGTPMGVYGNAKIEDGIGMHANVLLTFNLDEIRDAGTLGATAFAFTADAGLNDDAIGGGSVRSVVIVSGASGVIAGYINGQAVSVTASGGVSSFDGAIPAQFSGIGGGPYTALFNVPIPADAKYLTLASTSGGDIGNDQAVFSEANLTTVPEPASIGVFAAGTFALLARRRRS